MASAAMTDFRLDITPVALDDEDDALVDPEAEDVVVGFDGPEPAVA